MGFHCSLHFCSLGKPLTCLYHLDKSGGMKSLKFCLDDQASRQLYVVIATNSLNVVSARFATHNMLL